MGSAGESSHRSNNDNSLEMRLYRSSNRVLRPPGATRLLAFPMVAGCGFSRLLQSWRAKDGHSASENATKLTILTKMQPFFMNKYSPDWCKPLVNFQSAAKVDSDHFCHFL